jgi:hypothetical protein
VAVRRVVGAALLACSTPSLGPAAFATSGIIISIFAFVLSPITLLVLFVVLRTHQHTTRCVCVCVCVSHSGVS